MIDRKSIDLPPAVRCRLMEYMHAFFAEPSGIKRDRIAAEAGHLLEGHHGGRLGLPEVKLLFHELRDE